MFIALNVTCYALLPRYIVVSVSFLVWTASPVNRWQYIVSVEML